MKKIITCHLLAALFACQYCFAQTATTQNRLIAKSTYYAGGTVDTIRFYYSGNRVGNSIDADGEVLPLQQIGRNGLPTIAYDSAITWRIVNGFSTTIAKSIYAYDANNRITSETSKDYRTPSFRTTTWAYNVNGLCRQFGFADSQYNWPGMMPSEYKYCYYNGLGQPTADTFKSATTQQVSLFGHYLYDSGNMLTDFVRYQLLPTPGVVDSLNHRYNSSGQREISTWALFNNDTIYAFNIDSFGYTGSNTRPSYTSHKWVDQSTGPGGRVNTVSQHQYTTFGKVTSTSNYYANSLGQLPTTPSQTIVATYNADSTLRNMILYGSSSTPSMIINYYYGDGTLPTTNIAKISPASEKEIVVYPIPSKAGAGIQVKLVGFSAGEEVLLVDLSGKTIRKVDTRFAHSFTIEGLSPGHYFLRSGMVTKRLMIY